MKKYINCKNLYKLSLNNLNHYDIFQKKKFKANNKKLTDYLYLSYIFNYLLCEYM